MEFPNYITDEVRSLIGVAAAPVQACDLVNTSEVRRFYHAIIDPARRYWDVEWARNSRYGDIVAPPAFPVFAIRRAPNTPDPLDAAFADPDFDGLDATFRNLPPVPVPLHRVLNGGYEYTFYRYAKIGKRVVCRSRYRDIYQKNGRTGPMVFVAIDDSFYSESDGGLLDSTSTIILR